MKRFLMKCLRQIGWLHFDLLVRRQAQVPIAQEIGSGDLVVVENGEIEKWACLNCPGGCGQMIALSLNPARRPRWQVLNDFWQRPTVSPSVHQQTTCGCHFWIRDGRVDWCEGGKPPARMP